MESLEDRNLLAVYLPDTFADVRAQPVALSYRGGEQLFFTDQRGHLQFGFGQSVQASRYQGSGWTQLQAADLTYTPSPQPIGRVAEFHNSDYGGGALHLVYRAAGGNLIIIDAEDWTWQGIPGTQNGNLSDPTTNVINSKERIYYIAHNAHVRTTSEEPSPFTIFDWNTSDWNDNLGLAADTTANAVPSSGVVGFQVGDTEHVVYERTDGALGVINDGPSNSYDILNATTLPGYVGPMQDASGELTYASYDYTGQGGAPNVGWVIYRDLDQNLRGVWKVAGQPWRTAVLAQAIYSAPAALYDPVEQKLKTAIITSSGTVIAFTEAPTGWTAVGYQVGAQTIPLAGLSMPSESATLPASGRIALSTFFAQFTITAQKGGAADGVVGNATDIVFQSGASTAASYDAISNTITVDAANGATSTMIANAIDALDEFLVSDIFDAGPSFGWTSAAATTRVDFMTGGGPGTLREVAARPVLYWRPYTIAGEGPGMHIVFRDQANHMQNFRAAGQSFEPVLNAGVSPIFDSTAFLEGYRPDYGYGVVNAARALAYALNLETAFSGGSPTAWNLDLIHAPAAWTAATGANTAVFVLDSGFDPNNVDMQTLPGSSESSNPSVDDVHGHGTATAGIIAGANDGSGITGVAHDAQVIPIKIGDPFVESETSLLNGINAAVNYSLPGGYAATRVINLGFAYAFDTEYRRLVLPTIQTATNTQRLTSLLVAAAGNRSSSRPDMPAGSFAGYGIVAGALDSSSELWDPNNGTSGAICAINYLLAPGVDVPVAALVGSSGNAHNTTLATGSGMAAAHISGVAALMLEANPDLTPREIEAILVASADPVIATNNDTQPAYPVSIYWA
jgi:hypothetical protein